MGIRGIQIASSLFLALSVLLSGQIEAKNFGKGHVQHFTAGMKRIVYSSEKWNDPSYPLPNFWQDRMEVHDIKLMGVRYWDALIRDGELYYDNFFSHSWKSENQLPEGEFAVKLNVGYFKGEDDNFYWDGQLYILSDTGNVFSTDLWHKGELEFDPVMTAKFQHKSNFKMIRHLINHQRIKESDNNFIFDLLEEFDPDIPDFDPGEIEDADDETDSKNSAAEEEPASSPAETPGSPPTDEYSSEPIEKTEVFDIYELPGDFYFLNADRVEGLVEAYCLDPNHIDCDKIKELERRWRRLNSP